jgi:hypothetical protein
MIRSLPRQFSRPTTGPPPCLRRRDTCLGSLSKDGPFELRDGAEDVEDQPPPWRAGVGLNRAGIVGGSNS